MGTTTIFIIAMSFADFDDCWNHWHSRLSGLTTVQMHQLCTPYTIPVRPRMRPTKETTQ